MAKTTDTPGTTPDSFDPKDISAHVQARILAEALPNMLRYDEQTVVIKFGGHAMGDQALSDAFAKDIVYLKRLRWLVATCALSIEVASQPSGVDILIAVAGAVPNVHTPKMRAIRVRVAYAVHYGEAAVVIEFFESCE